MFDLDGDGYVCAEDLKQVMKALGNDLTGRQRESAARDALNSRWIFRWVVSREESEERLVFFLEGPSKDGHVAMGDWE